MTDAALHPEQLSPDALPDRIWDAAVVGAGPAGAAAAATLAAGGYHVLLLDREAFPRDKVCGDGLLPDALAALDRLGVREDVYRYGRVWEGLSVWSPGRIEAVIPGQCVTLRRRFLDATLVSHAAKLGACFVQGDVLGLDDTAGDEVILRVAGNERPVRARIAILATGAKVNALRRLGLPVAPSKPDAVAVRCYIRSSVLLERPLISYDRQICPGYAWIFPLSEGVYNVGCGTFRAGRREDLANAFQHFVAVFPPARELLAGGELLTPLRGAPLRCALTGAGSAVRGRILLTGEAVGTTLPFTGEGVGKAMETGERAARAAAECLRSGDPGTLQVYTRGLAGELAPRYAGYQRAEKWLSRAWVCDLLAHLARRSGHLREAVGRVLREEAPPSAVFSARGLARSLLG